MLKGRKTLPILEKIIDAHGGRALWGRLHAIEAEISARGLLFTLKRRPVLDHVRMTAVAHEPRFLFHDHPSPGMTGELIGNEEVRILDNDGRVVESRRHPRASMGGLNKLFRWDALDFVYFGGYATWNYLVTPFLLLHEGVEVEALKPPADVPSSWICLRAHFPEAVPTHSPVQTYSFDERLRLRRLDYVAEVVGSWAHAAHFCEDYRDFDGLQAPTTRRVHPILFGDRVLPAFTLVALDVHEIRPVPRGPGLPRVLTPGARPGA